MWTFGNGRHRRGRCKNDILEDDPKNDYKPQKEDNLKN